MVSAYCRRRIACAALAVGAFAAIPNAHAQGPERRAPLTQPLEVWSRATSGLGALDLGCQPALGPWQVRETVDPWAPIRANCEPTQLARVEFVATAEIVDPWPTRPDAFRAETREIIDPWAPLRR